METHSIFHSSLVITSQAERLIPTITLAQQRQRGQKEWKIKLMVQFTELKYSFEGIHVWNNILA